MKMFIDGQWVEASDGAWMEIRNPGTGEVLDRVPRGTLEDATRMVAAAQKGKLGMRRLTANQRYQILNKVALAIEAHGEELGKLLAAENGKPIPQTRAEVTGDGQHLPRVCRGEQAHLRTGDAGGCRARQ